MADIAFDRFGALLGTAREPGPLGRSSLYRIDITTGTATFVAPILDRTTGTPPSGGVLSLQYSCDGTLYGGTAAAIGGASDGLTYRD